MLQTLRFKRKHKKVIQDSKARRQIKERVNYLLFKFHDFLMLGLKDNSFLWKKYILAPLFYGMDKNYSSGVGTAAQRY